MKKILTLLGLIALFLVYACNLPGPSNLYGLVGEWVVTEIPTNVTADYSNYEKLIFTSTKYQIENKAGDIFESGSISNVTDSSYNYIMEQFTPEPAYEGSECSAVFSINSKVLTITFHNREKTDNYGTLKAERL